MKCHLIAGVSFLINTLSSQNALIYFPNGDTLPATVQAWNVTRDMITARVKGKKKDLPADSIIGFKADGQDYLSLKTSYKNHHEFCIKVKSAEEFNVYGWEDLLTPNPGQTNQAITIAYRYEYIKRPNDEHSRVFKFNKEGLSQIPFLRCQSIMDSLLKKASDYDDMKELVDIYDRECGLLLRNK